ncbi:Ig-like domain-containing protein, partial [Bacteroidales bacterium OttesenSCG-928-C19]|nr:Ig-like domain-containing protein [Bacteroidales bacterium OttesenSCG-928-C19]
MKNCYKFFKRRELKAIALLVFCAVLFVPFAVFSQDAQVVKQFAPRTSLNTPNKTIYSIKGDYAMIGNVNLSLTNYGNTTSNSSAMSYQDEDGISSTINSSAATLTFSGENGAEDGCTNIIYAGLYWSGRAHNSDGNYAYNPQVWVHSTTNSGSAVQVPATASGIVYAHNYTLAYTNAYTLTVSRQGTSSTGTGTRYVRYTFTMGSTTVDFEYTNTTGAQQIRYRTNNGSWSYPTNISINTISGNLVEAVFDPVTILSGTLTITVDRLTRDSRANQGETAYRNSATARASVTGTSNYVSKILDKSVVYLKHATKDAEYTRIAAQDNNFQENIYYPQTTNGQMYAAYAEVTDLVRKNGVGEYLVADLAVSSGTGGSTGYYGGWGMVVVYENAAMKWRDITVFDGYAYVFGGTAADTINVSGFHAVQEGDVNVKLGIMAGEGDVTVTGDYFQMSRQTNGLPNNNFQNLVRTDGQNPGATNFFNSAITGNFARRPNLLNNTGIDIAVLEVPNTDKSFVRNNQTSTRFRYGSGGDTYIIYCLVVGIDAYIPEPEIMNAVYKINGSTPTGYTVLPGGEIEYTVEISNKGTEVVDSVILNIPIPYTAKYVEESAIVTYLNNGVQRHEDPIFNPSMGAAGAVVWYVGDLPISNVNDNDGLLARMTFRVTITEDCSILASSNAKCLPEATLTGTSSGRGHESGVSFSDRSFIYGYKEAPCEDDPITDPQQVTIDAADFCAAYVVENPELIRLLKLCHEDEGNIPFNMIAENFPSGMRYYDTIDVETGLPLEAGYNEYTLSTGFPYNPDKIFYAVPNNIYSTCYWAFRIANYERPSVSVSDGGATICRNGSVNLNSLVSSDGLEGEISYTFYRDAGADNPLASSTQSPNQSTTYYVQAQIIGSQCFSTTAPIAITVNPVAEIANITEVGVCTGEAFSVDPATYQGNTIPANTSYSYEATTIPLGVTGVASGVKYTGSVISRTLYIGSNTQPVDVIFTVTPITRTDGMDCNGTPFTITVTVKPRPANPAPRNITVCYNGSIDLSTAIENPVSGVTYNYYTASTGGEPIATALTNVTTGNRYYVEAVLDGCVSNSRTEFQLLVEALPATPTITTTSPTICSGETLTFSASSPSATIHWYSAATGGTSLGSGNSYTSGVANENINTSATPKVVTYYAEAVNASGIGCVSSTRTAVPVTINAIATAGMITANDLWICTGNAATLTASAEGTITSPSYYWYTSLTAETPVSTTNLFTTDALTATITRDTVFYVSASGTNYCENLASNRKPVTVKVNQMPTLTVSIDNDTLCSGSAFTLRPVVSGIDTADWYGWYKWNGSDYLDKTGEYSEPREGALLNLAALPRSFTYTPTSADISNNEVSLRLQVQTRICGYLMDTADLTILPYPTSGSIELVTQPQLPQELCADTVYEVKIKSTNIGELAMLKVTFDDYLSSGIDVKNAYYFSYNESGEISPSGILLNRSSESTLNKIVWGFPEDYILESQDSVLVQIVVAAGCDNFSSNRDYHIRLDATGICKTNPITQQSVTTNNFITFNDVLSDFTVKVLSSYTPAKVTPAQGDTVTWNITYVLNSDNKDFITSGNEKLNVFFPTGLRYVNYSYNPVKNASEVATGYNPNDVGGASAIVPVLAGLSNNDTIIFEMKFSTHNALCQTYNLRTSLTIEMNAKCGEQVCPFSRTLGQSALAIDVERYNFILDEEQSPVNSYVDNNKWYGSYEFIAKNDFYAGDTLFVDFYKDANNNNIKDESDGTPVYQMFYITEDISKGEKFTVEVTSEKAIAISDKDQLLIHLYGEEFCSEAVYQIVIVTGPQIVCQGDVTYYTVAHDKKDYSFPVPAKIDGTTGATPMRLALEGRETYDGTEDTARIHWRGAGSYRVMGDYFIETSGGARINLLPTYIDVQVIPAPYLDYVHTDSIAICQGTGINLANYIKDTSNLEGTEISFYEKESGNFIGTRTAENNQVIVEPWSDIVYVAKARCTSTGCNSLNEIEFKVKVQDMPAFGSIAVKSQPTCEDETGSIEFVITGGSGFYEYRINNDTEFKKLTLAEGIGTISGLGVGHYTVYVRDSVNTACSESVSESITLIPVNSSLTATAFIIDTATTCTSTDASIGVFVNGGIAPYQYSINGGDPKDLPSDGVLPDALTAGRYDITIYDATGCGYAIEEVFIQNKEQLVLTFEMTKQATCSEPGWSELNVLGGSGSYEYRFFGQGWKPLNENPLEGTMPPGYHEFWVRDIETTCEAVVSLTVTVEDNALAIEEITATDATCDGIDNGSITMVVAGENTLLSYSIDAGITYVEIEGNSVVIPDLSTGVYDIILKDNGGCTYNYANVRVGLTKESNIHVSGISIVTQPTCEEDLGSFHVSVYGGSGKYEYNLDGGTEYEPLPESGIIGGLPAGVYTVYLRDIEAPACNRVISPTIRLTSNSTDLIVEAYTTPATNCTDSDGSLTVLVSGGTKFVSGDRMYYKYNLDGSDNFIDLPSAGKIENLKSGLYVVTIIGAADCEAYTQEVLIENKSGVTLTLSENSTANCNEEGSIKIKVDGGQKNYTYRILGGDFTTFVGDSVIVDVAAGTHTVYVQDATGCLDLGTVTVGLTENEFTIASIETSNANCDGTSEGSIAFTVTGGNKPFRYRINEGAYNEMQPADTNVATITGLAEGTYTLFVIDEDSCEVRQDNIFINTIKEPNIEIHSIALNNQPTCTDSTGSVVLSLTGGSGSYDYQLNGVGAYKPLTEINVEATEVEGAGRYYRIDKLPVGSYKVYVRDASTMACPPSASPWISLEPANSDLAVRATVTNSTDCDSKDGKITMNIGGGKAPYTYRVNQTGEFLAIPDAGTLTGLEIGDYIVEVKDSEGCTSSTVARIRANGGLIANVDFISGAHCAENAPFFIKVAGGTPSYSYKLDYTNFIPFTGDSIVVEAPAGDHIVWIRDAVGCEIQKTITIPSEDNYEARLVSVKDASCDATTGGEITIELTGPSDLSLELAKCYIAGRIITGEKTAIKNMTVDGLATGTYDAKFEFADGCIYELNGIIIGQENKSNVKIQSIYVAEQSECGYDVQLGTVNLVVSGGRNGYKYALNTEDEIARFDLLDEDMNGIYEITGVPIGTHTIYVWDAESQNCPGAASNPIAISPKTNTLKAEAITTEATDCSSTNGTITIIATGGHGKIQYRIGNTGNFEDLPHNGVIGTNFASGEYSITVSDESECTAVAKAIVKTDESAVNLKLSEKTRANCATNGEMQISINPTGIDQTWRYQLDGSDWRPFISNTVTEEVTAGWHEVWVKDENGCITSASVEIRNVSGIYAKYIGTTPAECSGVSGGSITIDVDNGLLPIRITNLANIETTVNGYGEVTLPNLATGVYHIEVIEVETGCKYTLERIEVGIEPGFLDATDDYAVTYVNQPVTGNVLTNDYDIDLVGFTFIDNTEPENGTITIETDGTYTYTPNSDYAGEDQITYTMQNSCGATAEAELYITVLDEPAENRPPLAVNDHFVTKEDTPITTTDVRANDIDPDGGVLEIPTIVTEPINGTVVSNNDGTFTYTPRLNFVGVDEFTYEVCNGNDLCDEAVVQITVYYSETSDTLIAAYNDAYSVAQYEELVVNNVAEGLLSNDIYPADATTKIEIKQQPKNGTLTKNDNGTFTYVPNIDFYGADYFVYELCADKYPNTACDSAFVNITVTGTTCPPILAPTVSTPQEFCGSATVGNLYAVGTNVKWYDVPTGGQALYVRDELVDGQIYYASQSISENCESAGRSEVKVSIVNELSLPVVNIPDTFLFCDGDYSLAQLFPNLQGVVWYSDALGTVEFDVNGIVRNTNEKVLYVAYKAGTCESETLKKVTILFSNEIDKPVIANQTFCKGAIISDIKTPAYNDIAWFVDEKANPDTDESLSVTTVLKTGTYYAARRVNTESVCYSGLTPVNITINGGAAPVVRAEQAFCGEGTLADVHVLGYGIQWHASATSTDTLPLTTPLVNGTTYFADQGNGICGTNRAEVTVTINELPDKPTVKELPVCYSDTVNLLSGITNNLKGETYRFYTSETGTQYSTATVLRNVVNDTTFWVVAVTNGCESAERTQLNVSVEQLPAKPTIGSTASPYCSGANITLTATGTGGTIYWYDTIGRADIETGGSYTVNPTITTTTTPVTKTYYVNVISDNNCKSALDSVRIQVNPFATDVMITAANGRTCTDNTVTLTASATGVTNPVYTWYNAENTQLTTNSNTYTTGTLTATLKEDGGRGYYDTIIYVSVKGDNYCENIATARKAVSIRVLPQPKLTINHEDAGICYGSGEFLLTPTVKGLDRDTVDSFKWYYKNTAGEFVYKSGLAIAPSSEGGSIPVSGLTGGYIPAYADTTKYNHIELKLELNTGTCGMIDHSVELILLPEPVEGKLTIEAQPAEDIRHPICTPLVYDLTIATDPDKGDGAITNTVVALDDYNSTGIAVDSAFYEWPRDPESVWNPLDIKRELEYFEFRIPTDDGNSDNYSIGKDEFIRIRIYASAGCEFYAGSNIKFLLDGTDLCGTFDIKQVEAVANVINIDFGKTREIEYALTSKIIATHVERENGGGGEVDFPGFEEGEDYHYYIDNDINDTLTWRATFSYTGSGAPDATDSLYFLIPTGLKTIDGTFKSSSHNDFYSDPNNAPKVSFDDATGLEYSLPLPAGLAADEEVTIEFQLDVDSVECDDYYFYMEVISTEELYCGAAPELCNVYETRAGSYFDMTIQWYNMEFVSESENNTGTMTGNEWTGKYEVHNISKFYNNDDLFIDFYIDRNNNGIIDATDTLVVQQHFLTVAGDADARFVLDPDTTVYAEEGYQLLATHYGASCDEMVVPISTLFGPDAVCVGDTVIYTAPRGMLRYNFATSASVQRVALEGGPSDKYELDSVARYTFPTPGVHPITLFYYMPDDAIATGYRVMPVVRNVNVYPKPALAHTYSDTIKICQATPIDMLDYVEDLTTYSDDYEESIIQVYRKVSGEYMYAGSTENGNTSVGQVADAITDFMYVAVGESGCTDTLYFVVDVDPEIITSSISVVDQPTCNNDNGSFQLVVRGGSGEYQYNFDGSSTRYDLVRDGEIATFKDLPVGNYNVYVYDKNPSLCGVAVSRTITLSPANNSLIAHAIVTDANDCTSEDGAIQLVVNGGVEPYRYTVNGGSLKPLPASGIVNGGFRSGSYQIAVYGDDGCEYMIPTVFVGHKTGLTATLELVDSATCQKYGAGRLAISGGIEPYIYQMNGKSWKEMVANPVVGELPAGHQHFTVRDADGCQTSVEIDVPVKNNQIEYEIVSVTDATCDGLNSGSISFVVKSEVAAYYSVVGRSPATLKPANSYPDTTVIDNLSVGSYNLIITNEENCFIVNTAVEVGLTKENILRVDEISVASQPRCNDLNGSIKISVSGGSGNYQYQLNGAGQFRNLAANGIITGLNIGTYFVTVRDADALACPSVTSESVTLKALSVDMILTAEVTNVTSCGDSDGKLFIEIGGGTAPYLYRVSPSNDYLQVEDGNTITIEDLKAGPVSVYVREDKTGGCIAEITKVIKAKAGIDYKLSAETAATCTENGTFKIKVEDGTPSYSYRLDNTTFVSFSGDSVMVSAAAGTHFVEIRDGDSCVVSDTITVLSTSPSSVALVSTVDAACDGTSGGSVSVRFIGDIPESYTIKGTKTDITGASTTLTIEGLATGSYNILFTYADDCVYELNNIEIGIDSDTRIEAGSIYVLTQPTCADSTGRIQLVVTGGSGRYVYNFDNTAKRDTLAASGIIDKLPVGNYTVYVWDEDMASCTAAISNTVKLSPATNTLNIVATPEPANSCTGADGGIQIKVTGGNGKVQYRIGNTGNYSDIPSDGYLGDKTPGEYTITVRDADGCTSTTKAIVLTEGSDVDLSLTEVKAANCDIEGELLIEITPETAGYTWHYQLDGRDWRPFINNKATENVTAGTHQVLVRNKQNCYASGEIIIENESSLNVELDSTITSLCEGTNDGGISITIEGGTAPYTITNGANIDKTVDAAGTHTITGLSAGTYQLTVTDHANCIAVVEKIVIEREINIVQAIDNRIQVYKNQTAIGNVLFDDYEYNRGPITLISNTSTSHGSLTLTKSNGNFTYVPNTNYVGRDTAQYTIQNTCGFTSTARLYIEVIDTIPQTNRAPIAMNDYYKTKMNESLNAFEVRANDLDPDGDVLATPVIVDSAVHGTLVQAGNGTFSYTPIAGFVGVDEFIYKVCDPAGLCDTAKVFITVYSEEIYKDSIVALPDNYTIAKYDTLIVSTSETSILNNDIWPDPEDGADITILEDVKHGTLNVNTTDGTFTYVPDEDYEYAGPDYFVYTLCTEHPISCDTAYVHIFISERECVDPVSLVMTDTLRICLGDSVDIRTAIDFDNSQNIDTVFYYSDNEYTNELTSTFVKSVGYYYVEARNIYECSEFDSVYVDVYYQAVAADITADNDTVCMGSTATLTASSTITGVEFTWYSDVNKVNLISTGDTLRTGTLTSDTTFYVSIQNDTICENAANNLKAVHVKVARYAVAAD